MERDTDALERAIRKRRPGLDSTGWCIIPGLLSADECTQLAVLYAQDRYFRSTVVMARHGYGSGEYRYFRYPLPPLIESMRTALYPSLAAIANEWNEWLGDDQRFPGEHGEYLAECARAGQSKATPLILEYGAGDYNRLHQDLYGEHVFPLQVAILLSKPESDFTGGEFVITEQRPRMQSRAHVVPLGQGDAVVFAVNQQPRKGPRGYHRVRLRHGVSTLHSGRRLTAGIIFHDAC